VMVRGDCDEMEGIPLTKSVSINGIEIGLIHGHQIIPWGDEESLKSYQR
jgi:vacuolar protein sorting-associated protein 29